MASGKGSLGGMTRLADRLTPCGPVIDGKAAERTREILTEKLDGAPVLEVAWPALAPVFGASPYLSGLARRRPGATGACDFAGPPRRRLKFSGPE